MAKTVMQKADDILAQMGIGSSNASVHAVGLNSKEELPELTNEQRNLMIEGSKKAPAFEKVVDEEPKDEMPKKKSKKLKKKGKPLGADPKGEKGDPDIADAVAHEEAEENTTRKLSKKKLKSKGKNGFQVEMTSVGMVGVGALGGKPPEDLEKPKSEKKLKKKGEKKGKKKKGLTDKFISFEMGKVK
mgnify:CR=1 FL=1|tara:strand:+ start:5894 stop:6454 length:561 start_codon:yes stop_codon:yes gene_type:complete